MSNSEHLKSLNDANTSLANHAPRSGNRRPVYHFTPPFGWMNDPNGLIQYNGIYHMFYQYNPYDTHWALMHWGHAISRDLVHWTDLPVALAPSEEYDLAARGGCYSGSAIEDGKILVLMYTGCVHREEAECQTQNLAYSTNGIDFIKEASNPVITQPPSGGAEHFRDPKVWQHGKFFYSVLCNSMDDLGCVLLYRSRDLLEWEYRGVLLMAEPGQGWMWECPDFFPLGDRWILTVSAMGALEDTNIWFAGALDYDTEHFTPVNQGKLDCGNDFYAAQSFLDSQNRRILIGWASQRSLREGIAPDAATASSGFCGQMSLPRIVSLGKDDALHFSPIPELKALRGNRQQGSEQWLDSQPILLSKQKSASCEIIFVFDLKRSQAKDIIIVCEHDELHRTTLTLNLQENLFQLDRSQTDDITTGIVTCQLGKQNKLTMQLFFDRNSVEVFINDGEQVLSANIFPTQNEMEIFLYSSGGTCLCTSWETWSLRDVPER